ncbi:hypothetical protein H5410_003934 [Solanum commersonii]|uniref:Uncharacterized protein n=1 Tax=Solanum commersonii TaxID=4109 RepID=A0A9J6B6C0_SOLCO|nr:hypothetical protein H5410_003934 [Solanum commersonii]
MARDGEIVFITIVKSGACLCYDVTRENLRELKSWGFLRTTTSKEFIIMSKVLFPLDNFVQTGRHRECLDPTVHLGHIATAEGVSTDPEKVHAMLNLRTLRGGPDKTIGLDYEAQYKKGSELNKLRKKKSERVISFHFLYVEGYRTQSHRHAPAMIVFVLLQAQSGALCWCYDVMRKRWRKLVIKGLPKKSSYIKGIYSYVETFIYFRSNSEMCIASYNNPFARSKSLLHCGAKERWNNLCLPSSEYAF